MVFAIDALELRVDQDTIIQWSEVINDVLDHPFKERPEGEHIFGEVVRQ